MRAMILIAALALVGCDADSPMAASTCDGTQLVHYRVAVALMETEGATCEPTGHDGAWSCTCL